MPKNTDEMKYNMKKHLYVLELDYVKSQLGVDFLEKLGSETKAKDMLYRISRTVYNWIYAHTHYKKMMEYQLAFDEDWRPIIQEALEEQARYEYETDAEFFTKQFGINVVNGIQIPLGRFRGESMIAPHADNILRDNKILFQGQKFITKRVFDYEAEGY